MGKSRKIETGDRTVVKKYRNFLIAFSGTFIVSFAYWLLYGKPIIGIDDANIYFVYVKNFVNGSGFVYNPGGERVEGFTSILWLWICSIFFVFFEHFEIALLFACTIIASFAIYLAIDFLNRINFKKQFINPVSVAFFLLLTLIPGYIDWTVLTLMETGFWSLLMIAIVINVAYQITAYSSSRVLLLSLLIALSLLTRPESILLGLFFIALLFLIEWVKAFKFSQALLRVAYPCFFFITTIAALTAFRLSYFGYPLPNTYYAKVSDSFSYNVIAGIKYLIYSLIQSPLFWVIIVSIAISIFIILKKGNKAADLSKVDKIQFFLCLVSALSILIPIYLGGDHFKLLRFFQPFFPIYLMVLLNIPFWKKNLISFKWNPNMAPLTRSKVLWVTVAIPFIYLLTDTPLHFFLKEHKGGSPIGVEFTIATLGRETGNDLNNFFGVKEKPSIGVTCAGGLAYTYHGKVIDLMGLNNTEMAHALEVKVGYKNHAAFDYETFYRQQPDIFYAYNKLSAFINDTTNITLQENQPEFSKSFVAKLYKNIFSQDQFKREYIPVILISPYYSKKLKTYARKDYLRQLKASGFKVIELSRV